MKKMLSILASLAIVSTAASSVVSCGPKIEHDVLLLLPGDVMSQTSKVTKAYKQLVADFDDLPEMKKSNTKVIAKWETGNAVQQRSSSFQQVPDLYVENGDQTAMYAYDFENGKNVRNMATSVYPDLDEAKADEKIDNQYWSPNFSELGKMKQIDGDQEHVFSLSLIKSFDLSVVNMKMVNEILHIAGIADTGVDNNLANNVFDDTKAKTDFGNSDSAKTILKNWNTIDASFVGNNKMRFFFKSDENVLALSKLYSNVYYSQKDAKANDWKAEGITNNKRLFPIGIDDIPNKIMYEYADKIKGNITISNTKDFLYSVNGVNPDKGKMDITINNSSESDSGYSSSESFFDEISSLRDKNKDDTDKLQAWAGSMAVGKIDGKTYTSNYFNQGTMMEASSSSAGTWAFKGKSFNNKTDLLAVGGASLTGSSYNFVSQGPQLAGFKSVGKNKAEKEKIVTKFLNFLLNKDNQNKLALLSGYIPADKDALSTYMPYISGTINKEDMPAWAKESKYGYADPILKDFLSTYSTYNPSSKGQYVSETEFQKNANMISVQPNPAGGMIRSAIGDIMLNYVLANHASFADMFKDEKKQSSLKYYITYNLLPDEFNSSNVSYTNN